MVRNTASTNPSVNFVDVHVTIIVAIGHVIIVRVFVGDFTATDPSAGLIAL
jgi:hypothetical protein